MPRNARTRRGRRDPQQSLWDSQGPAKRPVAAKESPAAPAVGDPNTGSDSEGTKQPLLQASVSDAAAELLRSGDASGDKWETAAISFLEKNPGVLDYFISLARGRVAVIKAENAKRLERGEKTVKPRVGAKWIAEQLRNSKHVVKQCDVQGFKINNNHVTTFARLAVIRAPDLEPHIPFRKSRAQKQREGLL